MSTQPTNKTATTTTYPPPNLPEPLHCPRCDSTNTKFCYYNNYNLSQPRHFCKSCRRYWTQGGTLRNIPIGGSTRKTSKHRRSSSSSTSTANSTANSTSCVSNEAPPPCHNTEVIMPMLKTEIEENSLNLNENVLIADNQNASFMSLMSNQVILPNTGLGFGSGLGFGLCEMGLGVWPCNGVSNCDIGVNDTWQIGDEEGINKGSSNGLAVDEECGGYFGWPELAIATPGSSLK